MNQFPIRIEHILIFALYFALLFSLWHTYPAKIRVLRVQIKSYLPRKWKPRSPKDCPSCQSGIELAVMKPKSEVIPYAQRKSARGRPKHLATRGHACPNTVFRADTMKPLQTHSGTVSNPILGGLHHDHSRTAYLNCGPRSRLDHNQAVLIALGPGDHREPVLTIGLLEDF